MSTRILALGSLALALAAAPFVAFGATPYQVLAPLPGIAGPGGTTSLVPYVQGMFRLLIGLTVFLAVISIVFGGVQYLSTDTYSGKSEGRQRIRDAIYGLLLAIVAWIILNTIDPAILGFNLSTFSGKTMPTGTTGAPTAGGPITGGGGPITPGSGARLTQAEALTILGQNQFTINDPNRTSLEGIRGDTIAGIINLRQVCPTCGQLVITGGTEAGHSAAHTDGQKVDISVHRGSGAEFTSALREYTRQQTGQYPTTPQTIVVGNTRYSVWQEAAGTANEHWDIRVMGTN